LKIDYPQTDTRSTKVKEQTTRSQQDGIPPWPSTTISTTNRKAGIPVYMNEPNGSSDY